MIVEECNVWSVSMTFSWKKFYLILFFTIAINILVGCSSHQHVLSEYQNDEHLHWQECMECHEKVNYVYHTYGSWQVVKEPTETEEGRRKQVCSYCGFTREETISTVSHQHIFSDWEFLVQPTLTTAGKIKRVCTVDASHIEELDIPILNKTYYRYKVIKSSTCKEKGLEQYTLIKDNSKLEIEIEIPLGDHTYEAVWTFDSVGHWHKATCEHFINKDYQEHTFKNGYCTVCHYEEPKEEHVHVWDLWEVVKEPSLTENGLLRKVCKTNDSHVETYELPSLNEQDYLYEIIKESTCSSAGDALYRMEIDNQELKFEAKLPLGDHTFFKEWATDNQYHWHPASCMHQEERSEYAQHEMVNGRCSICNYISYSEGLIFDLNEDLSSYKIIGFDPLYYEAEIVIPSTYNNYPVTKIAASAFREVGCKSVTFLEGVIELEENCFKDCKNLDTVILPNSLKIIGSYAFEGCSSLKAFESNMGLEVLKDGVFKGCRNLTSVSLPDSIQSVGRDVFENCGLLYNEFSHGNYLGNEENPFLILFGVDDPLITSCQIHNKTKIIVDSALNECRALVSITIPDEIIYIGNSFKSCINLKYIILGKNVEMIARSAFQDCKLLEQIFYFGTKESFAEIEKNNNTIFNKAKVYYYSSNPSSSDEWSFDDKNEPVPFI